MLLPSIFRNNFWSSELSGLMKTDVKENEKGYELIIDLPGIKKEDIKAELKNGYLNITASCNSENSSEDEKNNYIIRERYNGSCSRSFYVGKQIKQENINAKFTEGCLELTISKPEEKPELEEDNCIKIA